MTTTPIPQWLILITRFAEWMAQLLPHHTFGITARKAKLLLVQLEVIECGMVLSVAEALREAPQSPPKTKPENTRSKQTQKPQTKKPADPDRTPAFRIPRAVLDMLGLYNPSEDSKTSAPRAPKSPAAKRRRLNDHQRFRKMLHRIAACRDMLLDPDRLIHRLARKMQRAAKPADFTAEGTPDTRLDAMIETYSQNTGIPVREIHESMRPPDG